MVEPTRLSAGASKHASDDLDCETLAQFAGDGACREVLLALCHREQNAEETTVWDIHRLTGLPLHEAFAALRTLEYGKIVDIIDNPSDPFGATIRLREGGITLLRDRNVA